MMRLLPQNDVQDNVRNQLIQFELLLTTATFVVAIFGVVAGVFGMNFSIPLFDEASAFKWVLVITGVCGQVGKDPKSSLPLESLETYPSHIWEMMNGK
ncbi:hypothetical protein ACLOJK_002655 [Asimina triloba]